MPDSSSVCVCGVFFSLGCLILFFNPTDLYQHFRSTIKQSCYRNIQRPIGTNLFLFFTISHRQGGQTLTHHSKATRGTFVNRYVY